DITKKNVPDFRKRSRDKKTARRLIGRLVRLRFKQLRYHWWLYKSWDISFTRKYCPEAREIGGIFYPLYSKNPQAFVCSWRRKFRAGLAQSKLLVLTWFFIR